MLLLWYNTKLACNTLIPVTNTLYSLTNMFDSRLVDLYSQYNCHIENGEHFKLVVYSTF